MKMVRNNEKGAALINVLLVVLLAIAIGLPLLYLVVTNFLFRAFDNNVRAISYKNEIGMDNVYAIIQEIIITNANEAKGVAQNEVDTQVKAEQDLYKAWVSDGRTVPEEVEGEITYVPAEEEDYLDLLREYKFKEGYITEEQYEDDTFDVGFKYLDINDGAINAETVKVAYNDLFKQYYKSYMDSGKDTGISFEKELKSRATTSPYNMKLAISGDSEQYAISTSDYVPYGTSNETTILKATVRYRGLSTATERYVNSEVSSKFTISMPNFDSASSISQTTVQISNPLLDGDRALVIGKSIVLDNGKSLTINGSTMVHGEGLNANEPVIDMKSKSKLNVDGRFSANGDIALSGGISADKNIITASGDLLCNEIKVLGEYTESNIAGKYYVSDDIEINKNNTTMNIGTLMGFRGEPGTNNNSAILFNDSNGFNSNTIDIQIGDAYMAGTARIDSLEYETGESVSVKGNYRVYQAMIKENYLRDNRNAGIYYNGSGLVDNGDILLGIVRRIRNNSTGITRITRDGLVTDNGEYDRFIIRKVNWVKDTKFRFNNIIYNYYKGIALCDAYYNQTITRLPIRQESNWDMTIQTTQYYMNYYKRLQELEIKDKTDFFLKVYNLKKIYRDSPFEIGIPTIKNPPISVTNWEYATGAVYFNNEWNIQTNKDGEEKIVNAAKDFDKYVKYFGYGEGNQYRLINNMNPTVVGLNGWIDTSNSKLTDAATKYNSFNPDDEVVVLVSNGTITLDSCIDGKKGIIIAGGDIIVGNDISFEGTIVCGGRLIVNNNFTIINSKVAVSKVIEDAISTGNKELFNLFRDDESGNLYTYSTIDTQIASIDMNSLIKISDWKKSKFDI